MFALLKKNMKYDYMLGTELEFFFKNFHNHIIQVRAERDKAVIVGTHDNLNIYKKDYIKADNIICSALFSSL